MASTKESQRYPEIPQILQLLQTIHTKLLSNGTATIRSYEKRHTLPMDRHAGTCLSWITGYTHFITHITTSQLQQTIYTHHRRKQLCCRHYSRTGRHLRMVSPHCLLLQIASACRTELQNP